MEQAKCKAGSGGDLCCEEHNWGRLCREVFIFPFVLYWSIKMTNYVKLVFIFISSSSSTQMIAFFLSVLYLITTEAEENNLLPWCAANRKKKRRKISWDGVSEMWIWAGEMERAMHRKWRERTAVVGAGTLQKCRNVKSRGENLQPRWRQETGSSNATGGPGGGEEEVRLRREKLTWKLCSSWVAEVGGAGGGGGAWRGRKQKRREGLAFRGQS